MKKFYTSNEIMEKFHSKTKKEQINLLLGALDYMQQYNGRTITLCIALAMNFENTEGSDNTFFKKEE
jgi:hypothetical protein